MACSGSLPFFITGSFPPAMPYVLAMPLYCMRVFNTNFSLSICSCTNLINSLSTWFLNLYFLFFYFFLVLIIAEICLGRKFNRVCSPSCRMQIATACFLGNDCLPFYVAASVPFVLCLWLCLLPFELKRETPSRNTLSDSFHLHVARTSLSLCFRPSYLSRYLYCKANIRDSEDIPSTHCDGVNYQYYWETI